MITFPIQASDSTAVDIYKEYVTLFMEKIEGVSVTIENEYELFDCESNEKNAILYQFESGYAIINVDAFYICEYSFGRSNPYAKLNDYNNKLYYLSPLEYYYKDNDVFRHVITQEECNSSFSSSRAVKSNLTDEQKHEKLQMLANSQNSNIEAKAIDVSNDLQYSLATDWINGYCGPTSAYIMLEYRGLVPSGYTAEETIMNISRHTGKEVSLTSLRNGINSFLQACGFTKRVSSMNYSFTKVMSEINANRPLTLGTPGHVQTIHGYNRYQIGTAITYYTLYTNDSWGENDVAISYETTAPSSLVDHVYFTS